ncbi:L-fucose:H+ symporter permease [Prolixibacter sp. NT017]|uniref:L-fucose:H+ symporter permease n=1 Tax=Prolixibacter sp. NT017 TaxID=2652390 RepID=UPI0012727057|nr:L-fucose:H+ symporter permease [Prolixibacter sp. NT017]GET24047.1 L-fucose permease [Prolixibacter sp. NT017]
MNKSLPVVERKYLFPFVLITSLFALWGFANDITNPMVAAFRTVMEISNARAALVQFAFYGGYATMAIPAALFIQRFSYKKGILMGLGLYAIGALMFYPAARFEMFGFFLLSLYILTFGLAFLETTSNPFILSMGRKETATRRLNLAQAFNPMGSLLGMFVASTYILNSLQSSAKDSTGNLIFNTLGASQKAVIRAHDLMIIRNPYVLLGIVVCVMFVVIALAKIPVTNPEHQIHIRKTTKRLLKNKLYREGVIAQLFYVAAQIMCWTFIIQYADHLGISYSAAEGYNMVAMGVFLGSRFISTFLMKYVNSRKLLTVFALGGIITSAGAIFIQGMGGLYSLIATSAFMSLMFPTIYGIALEKVDPNDTPLGASGLVMAIVGGALLPPLQGAIIDLGQVAGLPAVNFSFILPLFCFIIIALYGWRCQRFNLPSGNA